MKYSRKAAAVILSLIMTITMLPAMAFAEDAGDVTEATSVDVVSEETAAEDEAVQVKEPAVEEEEDSANDTSDTSAEGAADPLDTENAEAGEEAAAVSEDADEISYSEEGAVDEVSDKLIDEDEEFEGEISFSDSTDPDLIENGDPEKLMEQFLLREDGNDPSSGYAPEAPLSVKGSRLTGNDLKYYKYFKSMISQVNSGKRKSTTVTIPVTKILGKSTITAKSLGLSKLAYVKNGKLHLTKKAEKKILKMINPESWGRVYSCLISDLSADSYWVNWYSKDFFYKWTYYYRGNSKSITIIAKSSPLEYRLPVMPEFASSSFKVDQSKLKAAKTAKENAREIVREFDDYAATNLSEESSAFIDYLRLWYYCLAIADLTEYDQSAYEASMNNSAYWRSPWSLISVFDGKSSTKSVCAGYACAYKYLCDLSTFKSNWIDCQIATGDVIFNGEEESHMWNTVRMNDGLNYLVDPTWADNDSTGEVDNEWFLRGAPSGSASSFTIEDYYRVYDSWMKKSFAPAERRLSKKDYYDPATTDRKIDIPGTRITRKYRKSKSFLIKWSPVKSAVGALYIDGYQIQYSRNKSMKGAKSVYVKGYAQSSKLIKKLKKKKNYYVRIRTYAKVGRKTYHSEWSAKTKIKTK